MRLDYPDAWQRGAPGEEADDDSLILRQTAADDALAFYLPRRAVPLKLDTERFHQQLERKWRGQYGDAARIGRHLSAGQEWHYCIRPSVESRATVFHLVTVHAGRAHHILAIGARDPANLPTEVIDLLAKLRWPETPGSGVARVEPSATPDATQPESAASATAPARPSEPTSAATPATPAVDAAPTRAPAPVVASAAVPAPVSPADATPATPVPSSLAPPVQMLGPWRLLRAARLAASGPELDSLARVEADRLGEAGMLLGYGLSLKEDSLHAFLDGYEFDPFIPGKAGRKPFAFAWKWSWRMPEVWYPGIGLSLPLNRADDPPGAAPEGHTPSGQGDTGAAQPNPSGHETGWRIEALALCGPRLAMVRAFDALDRGDARAEAQLAALACPETARPLATASAIGDAQGIASLNLGRLQGVPDKTAAGSVRRLLLSLGADTGATGGALLRGARFLYIFGPDEKP